MLSIWERNSFLHYDHIVVGGGIVGLSTGYYLKQRFPQASVIVIERGLLPTGASTKNAGFACMGSPSELLDDLLHSTEDEVVELFLFRKKGLERLRQLLGDTAIGYAANGSYELLREQESGVADQLQYLNQLLLRELKQPAFRLCNDRMGDFGFNPQQIRLMIENCFEGELDTGLMMRRLMAVVQACGVEVKTGCLVSSMEETPDGVELRCQNPLNDESLHFSARQLFICTNAFARDLLPGYDVVPGRGQVLLTHPVDGLPFRGIFHFDKGYYYFREYHGRVLFGGGRNLEPDTERSTAFELNQHIQQDLEQKLHELILPGRNASIDLRWTGIMAFGATKRPILRRHSERIAVGVRMGGMGVAIGSEVGYQLAQLGHSH